MNYRCPLCTRKLEPHGTGGMTCSEGHHFLASQIQGPRPVQVVKAVSERTARRPWLPGALLGGLALLIEFVGLIVG